MYVCGPTTEPARRSQRAKSQNWLVLAMARYRLGEMEEAEHCLETGRQLIATARHKAADDEHDLAAGDWIELNVLLREAQTLLAEGIHSSELPR